MAGQESSRVNPRYEAKYRIRNWRQYERGLRDRGDERVHELDRLWKRWAP